MNAQTDTPTTVGPTINLNGSHVDVLFDQVQDALTALDKAIGALQVSAPHGRDYQCGPVPYVQARAQFEGQMTALQGVRRQLFDQLLLIADQRSTMSRVSLRRNR